MNNKTTRNSFLLLVTAAVWGAAFVARTVGGQTIGAYSFNCVRCIIGVLVLIPVMKFLHKKCGINIWFAVDMQHSISGIKAWAQAFLSCSAWIPILYAGALSSGVGYTLQIVGQKGMNLTVASLILSLESTISVIAGWLILGQELSARELIGCAMVMIAIVIVISRESQEK